MQSTTTRSDFVCYCYTYNITMYVQCIVLLCTIQQGGSKNVIFLEFLELLNIT